MQRSAFILLLFLAPLARADWKPAKGPLMTRWAKDVTPDKVPSRNTPGRSWSARTG